MIIVSIGAGKHQIPIIKACKDAGYKVVGVDKNTHAEGLQLCDIKIIESIYNYHEIYFLLKEILVFDDIAAIVTRSYGDAVKTVAYLCQQFRLPFIDFCIVDSLNNKSLFRAIATKNNIQMPRGYILNKNHLIKSFDIPFPCIAKPAKGHAKQSVKLVYNYDDLKRFIASNKSDYIIEEYIEGDEIIVLGFVYKNIFYICDISDKIVNAKPYFVDRMHILPSKYHTMYYQLQQLGQKIADIFALHATPLLMECVIKNNSIYLIEAACEFGGEYLADYAIPARSEYNIFKAFIDALINGKIELPQNISKASVVKYIMGRNGKLISYNNCKNKNLIHSEIFYTIGESLHYPTNNHQRLGVIVTKGKTVENAIQTADTILEQMRIIIE